MPMVNLNNMWIYFIKYELYKENRYLQFLLILKTIFRDDLYIATSTQPKFILR